SDPVHKISIIPRGHAALGYTLQLPEEDRFLISKSELMNRISVLLSGRVSEELVFNDVTSGAANDLERATQTARQMVTELGMSDSLGLVKLGNKREEIFLGRDISEDRNYSEQVAFQIDQEVKAIIDTCYENAKEILAARRALMDKIAGVLLEREVIDAEEFDRLMKEGTSSDINSKIESDKLTKEGSSSDGENDNSQGEIKRPMNDVTPDDSASKPHDDTGNPESTSDIPEIPDIRVDSIPKTGRDFLA
ncbi:MAG: hypothetical protein II964_08125, partial [Synergistaceae bacterium]|nr:hypothetical protein [Synergistaceae bacterium]